MSQTRRHLVVIVFLVAAVVLAYGTWHTSHSMVQGNGSQNTHGRPGVVDESAVSKKEKDAYTVAAQMPRMLYADIIQLQARIIRVGTTKDGAVDAPKNLDDAAWYEESALPGKEGVTFIDGHNQGKTREGVFSKIETLRVGQLVTIQLGSGQDVKYVVTGIESKSQKDIKMDNLLNPGKQGVNSLILMTCDGGYDRNEHEYTNRVIVYAEHEI